jgi:hypothetical protein
MFECLLEKIALALDQAAVPYMVIGGQAVLLHGEPRLTKDIDVTLGVGLDRLQEIRSLVNTIGLSPLVDPEDFTLRTMVLPCSDPDSGIRVDFVFSFSPYERHAIASALRVRIRNADVRFATAEDLVIHKVIAGRPRDLEDVRIILLKNLGIDIDYVRRWLSDFTSALAEDFSSRFEKIWESVRHERS